MECCCVVLFGYVCDIIDATIVVLLSLAKEKQMNCYFHPERAAVGTCTSCGKPICSECGVEVQDKLICRECLSLGNVPQAQDKDPNTAFLIELVGGLFGILGLGYLYVGRTDEGIVRLIGWLLYMIVSWVVMIMLVVVVIGIICIPLQLAIQIGVPLWSAMKLKNELLQSS